MVRMSKPAIVPEHFPTVALEAIRSLWHVVDDPCGEKLWIRMDGHSQYTSPFHVGIPDGAEEFDAGEINGEQPPSPAEVEAASLQIE
eukprot:2479621-Amphidinium_carterae.1